MEFLHHTSDWTASPTFTAKSLPCRLLNGADQVYYMSRRATVKYTRALNRWWSAPGTCLTHRPKLVVGINIRHKIIT